MGRRVLGVVGSLVLAGATLVATAAGAAPSGAQVFTYNGSEGSDGSAQPYLVPVDVCQVTVDALGAEAGQSANSETSDAGHPAAVQPNPVSLAGLGGHATATVAVTPGETLQVYVGGQGGDAAALATASANGPNGPTASTSATLGIGGFNGGADGQADAATRIGSQAPDCPGCCRGEWWRWRCFGRAPRRDRSR